MDNLSEIKYTIEQSPEAAILIVDLRLQQSILARTTALAARDKTITIVTELDTNNQSKFKEFLGEYNLQIDEFKPLKFPGQLYLAPDTLGTIYHYDILEQTGILLQLFSFLACSTNIEFKVKKLPLINQIIPQNSYWLYAKGKGDLWFSSYGNLREILVKDSYFIDLGYLVAFEDTLTYQLVPFDGLSFQGIETGPLGTKDLLCHFRGKGRLWIQSRHRYAFLNFFAPFSH